MLFRPKPKNRRLGREFVLDVKLRSSQVRAARMRLAAIGLAVLFSILFGAWLFWRTGAWTLDQLLYQNQAFAIQKIDVQTDGIIALDQLRRWSGVKPGDNLLGLDLARVKRDLELVPLIQSVSVERILPHTLCLRVAEREPIAQINLERPLPNGGIESNIFQLDAQGFVLVPLAPRERATPPSPADDQLPVICGINPRDLQPGRRLQAQQAQCALQLVAAFDSSPMAGLVDLRRIDLSAPEVLLVTTGQGSEITFGLRDLDQQLRRWHVVFDLVRKYGKAIATLDLAVTNNIPARWLEASALPPESPKLAQPVHTRKKHV